MKVLLLTLIFFSLCFSNTYKYTNKLIKEESPYLLQHAHNPVNWFAWNNKAFLEAKKQNKLIFVSIGYSTCHWCHVMEEESFKNEAIAKLLNKDYISIKIDKEEAPHLDTFYQELHSKLNKRRNGWPLNFILTPNKKLVFITTYIPDTFKYNTEGMDTLIPKFAKLYKENKIENLVLKNEKNLKEKFQKENQKKDIKDLENSFILKMKKRYDKLYHGFDKQPKFPLASHLNALFDISFLDKNKEAFTMVNNSLKAMSNGGINDQVEGGFYRYSVYPDWIVPHFEKMLYTQAELIPLYYKAFVKTKNKLFKTTIINTIKETNTRFKSSQELFFSASDADSKNFKGEKEEGFYFTYTYDEAKKAFLAKEIKNYEDILDYLGFDGFGNFENELNNTYIYDTELKKPKNLEKALLILKDIRKTKPFPFIDKKIITSWNAMYIKALFKASNLDKNYLKQAIKSLDSLLKHLYKNETLYHQKLDMKEAKVKALLEDYTYLVDVLIEAYQTTYEKKYLDLALKLNKETIEKFYKNKTWYLDDEKIYPVNFIDRYYTAAISKFFHNSLSLANLSYDLKLLEKTKIYIKEQENKILYALDKHPEALRAIIRAQKGDIIIKSNKKNLLKKSLEIQQINYPFILTNIEKTDKFLACDEKSCFAFDKDLEKLIKTIDSN